MLENLERLRARADELAQVNALLDCMRTYLRALPSRRDIETAQLMLDEANAVLDRVHVTSIGSRG